MVRTQPDISIIGLAGLIASTLFGPEVAAVVGPYIVILIASSVGASFAVARREKQQRTSVWFFFLRTVGIAVLLTVALASGITGHYPSLSERVLIAPIAFVLGFIGDDWPAVFRWGADKINKLVDALIKLRGGNDHGKD